MKKIHLIILLIFFIAIGYFSLGFINNNNFSSTKLGETELGTVYVEGPYGNPNSDNKIAIIIGVHPLEFKSHDSLLKHIKSYSKSLNNSYYVYIIDVTKDADDFDKGRLNGQILAREYVVPDIVKKKYSLSIDFHGHRGVYSENNFIIAPLNDKRSTIIGENIIGNINGMKILKYVPESDGRPTSPNYVSIPILKNGTPSLIYETYINESDSTTDNFMSKFLINLDKIDI